MSKISLPSLIFLYLFLIYPVSVFSQDLPLTIKTTYAQTSVANNKGLDEKLPPEKSCQFWYFEEIKFGQIKFQSCEEVKIDQIKITSADPTKFGPTGWSKRYFGYDPEYVSYMKDGSIIADWTVTIILNNGKFSIFKILSTSNPQTGVTESSVATMFYNL